MDCLFCKIASGEIPSTKVYEDAKVLAFRDISPQAPVHIVLIPKAHYENILEIPFDNSVINDMIKAVQIIAKQEGMEDEGFRVVNNCKEFGGQTVDHLHFHILGKRKLTWPPG
ncbi:histidine triad nucleotide-binding protein [Proteocatella sphenisci]|uniref:histidine triad nucleotide-binding protein n=1 Tax=Proteocatella sphenisci TaxID=181070 RepID=UPI0004901E7D|nr:histidine triad nucleotide-binding protein [Proteocatella sphenisci]